MNSRFDWDEVDCLISLLHTQGISYLLGNGSSVSEGDGSVDPVYLIQRLAVCGYPLVENASISLFIIHPELASSVVEALQDKFGKPPYDRLLPNLSQQQFSLHYQAVRQLL